MGAWFVFTLDWPNIVLLRIRHAVLYWRMICEWFPNSPTLLSFSLYHYIPPLHQLTVERQIADLKVQLDELKKLQEDVSSPPFICFLVVLRLKRGVSCREFICQDTQTPNVDQRVMRLVFNHFRRQVVQRSTKSLPSVPRSMNTPSEVSNFDCPLEEI